MNEQTVKIFIGVDPGSTGAISVLAIHPIPMIPEVEVIKMPETPREIQNLLQLKTDLQYTFITCEAVHSSPQMGVSTAFKFGRNFGWLEGILSYYACVDYVTPQKWQAALNCRTAGDKHISLARAKELFPDVKGLNLKTADSLLLAYYGYRKYGNKN